MRKHKALKVLRSIDHGISHGLHAAEKWAGAVSPGHLPHIRAARRAHQTIHRQAHAAMRGARTAKHTVNIIKKNSKETQRCG